MQGSRFARADLQAGRYPRALPKPPSNFGRDAYGAVPHSDATSTTAERPSRSRRRDASRSLGASAYAPILPRRPRHHRRDQVLSAMRETGRHQPESVTEYNRYALPRRRSTIATIGRQP